MKTKRLLSMLICICMFASTLLSTVSTDAMTEKVMGNIAFNTVTETGEQSEFEDFGIYSSPEPMVSYSPGKNDLISGDFSYVVNSDGKTATVTGYVGNGESDLIIPSEIDGYIVTTIGAFAFPHSIFTGSLVIPDSVTVISYNAFEDCSLFTGALVIPDSVTFIDDEAFKDCSGFSSLVIPDSVTTIGWNSFEGCSGFKGELVIPDSVTFIGDYAFSYCSGFTSLKISESLTEIGEGVFFGCSGFTGSLVIPDSVESIGWVAFADCSGFEGSLVIPDNVYLIETCAFGGCSGFCDTLVVPNSEIIYEGFAEYGGSFTTIVFSENITSVNCNFNFFTSLQKIYFNGNAPTDWNVANLPDSVIIYYLEGNTSGWTSPTWTAPDGTVYKTAIFNGISSDWDTSDVTLNKGDVYSFSGSVSTTAQNGFETIQVNIISATDEAVSVKYYVATDVESELFELSTIPSLEINSEISDGEQTVVLSYGTTWKVQLLATDADGNSIGDSEFMTLTVAEKEKGEPTVSGLTNYIVFLGESFNLDGTVLAFGDGLLNKVILQHNDENTTFEDQVLDISFESSTAYLSAFTLSTDSYPLNSVGTYEFGIYASADNYTDLNNSVAIFYVTVEHSCDWVFVEYVSGSEVWTKADEDFHKCISAKAKYKCSYCGKTKFEVETGTLGVEPHNASIEKINSTYYEILEETHEDYITKHKVVKTFELGCEANRCDYAVSGGETYVYEFHDLEDNSCRYCGFVLSSEEKVCVTFNLNDGEGTFPTAQEVVVGGLVKEPEDPSKKGYVFKGWYSNPDCTGHAWFSYIMNGGKGLPVISDITLYAKWEESQNIVYGKDTFSFINTGSAFGDDYTITGDYYDILLEGLNGWGEKAYVKNYMESDWGGSCFGMSAVLSLIRSGRLEVDFFQTNAKTTFELDAPIENNTINNLINYYHLMQCTYYTASIRGDYNHIDETENNKEILTALNESSYPVVVGFDILNKNGVRIGGHAVVAYGYEETDLSYNVSIWDPNDIKASNTLVISKDFTTSYFFTKYDTSVMSSYVKYALTVESEAYDYKNLQEELEKLGYSGGVEASSQMSLSLLDETRNLSLITNYNSFSISSSDGKSAIIENGRKTWGDLDITDGTCLNYYGSELKMSFSITDYGNISYTVNPVLFNGIVSGEPLTEYSTVLMYNDDIDGFYASVNAEGIGTVIFESDGAVNTQFESKVKQNITSVSNDVKTPWYAVSVELEDSYVSVATGESGAEISCTPGTEMTVSAEDDYNEVVFESYKMNSSGSESLIESSEVKGLCKFGDLEEKIGSSLIFYSMGGSPVASQTNIESGKTAVQPENPTRAGFMFGGWYTDAACSDGCEWDFNTPITENVRIYAKWHEDSSYTRKVTFKIDGMDDIICIVYDGADLAEDQIPEIPVKSGYISAWDISEFTNITSDMIITAVYTPAIVTGDIDNNGLINLDDVVALLRHVSKAAELTDPAVLAASDVTKDGKINLDDVVKLLRYVSKAIPDLE